MKRKNHLKMENPKTIDSALLEEILGGAQVAGDDKRIAVIAQVPFGSFFHS
jgi:hypothetical protein